MINAYYILQDNEQTGPFTHEELFENGIKPDTLVLSPIAENWQHAADLPELRAWFEREGYFLPGPTNMAGFGWRLLAYLIDYVFVVITIAIIYIIIGVVSTLSTGIEFDWESEENDLFFRLSSIVLMLFYHAAFEAMPTQGSVGKMICKLAVVDVRGKRISFANALGRNAGKFLSSMVCGLGFLSVLWDNEKRSWHDHLAKVYVVRKS